MDKETFIPPDSFIFQKQRVVYKGETTLNEKGQKMWTSMYLYEVETGYEKGKQIRFSKGNIGFYISQEKQTL